MSAESDLERLLDIALSGAVRFSRAEGGAVYLLRGDSLEFAAVKNDVLTRRYGTSEVRGRFHGRRLRLDGSSVAGYVAATGARLSVPDAYAIAPTSPYHLDARFDRENQYQTRSVLTLPLKDPAERLTRLVARYPFLVGPVTITIGVATIPGDAETHEDLVAAADRALYRAKREGRNRVGSS